MRLKFKDETASFCRRYGQPVGGINELFPNVKLHRAVLSPDCTSIVLFLLLLAFIGYSVHNAHPKLKSLEAVILFGSLCVVILFGAAYIILRSRLSRGPQGVIACTHVDVMSDTQNHLRRYFPLSISFLTFGGTIDAELEETLQQCLWVYHSGRSLSSWTFFMLKSWGDMVFLNFFLFIFFLERHFSGYLYKSILVYEIIVASIVVSFFSLQKLHSMHYWIAEKLPKSLAKLDKIYFTVSTPKGMLPDYSFFGEFTKLINSIDRASPYMFLMQILFPLVIAFIAALLNWGSPNA